MTEKELDRYEELESIRQLLPYKACYIITERDSKKGIRITKVDAESGGIARETRLEYALETLLPKIKK